MKTAARAIIVLIVAMTGCATESARVVCRHEATLEALTWQDQTGRPARVAWGFNDVKHPVLGTHAQAQGQLKDGSWAWLGRKGDVVMPTSQENFQPANFVPILQFIQEEFGNGQDNKN